MIKKINIIIALVFLLNFIYINTSVAYWIWTPKTKKFINPKNKAKRTPQKQFDWAMEFYEKKDYDKAENEFEKLIRTYPNAKLSPDSQYYIGLCKENKEEYYEAYKQYQKVIDKYPYNEKVSEVIKRQYAIANLFYEGRKIKVLKFMSLEAYDRAIEIFKQIVKNSPYGEFGDVSQYKIGLCYIKIKEYSLAIEAFEKLIKDYPSSNLVDDARYQIALTSAVSSPSAGYDQTVTEKAVEQLEEITKDISDKNILKDAAVTKDRLLEKKAKHDFEVAEFYEQQKLFDSALIYYDDLINRYPNNIWTQKALERRTAIIKAKK